MYYIKKDNNNTIIAYGTKTNQPLAEGEIEIADIALLSKGLIDDYGRHNYRYINGAVEEITDKDIYPVKQAKLNEIATDRYNYETGGITVDGAQIKTDRESVALLKGAYDEACDNPEYTVNWKAANGFVTLNAEQIITIYQRVKAHVQSSFDAEMRIDAQINAATTEEQLEAIHWVDPN